METPTTPRGLRKFDRDDQLTAILKAWNDPGTHPSWHREQQDKVRKAMPLLARALDRR